jgi:hypothetical protein
MEPLIWSKAEGRRASILMLQGSQVHRLEVDGLRLGRTVRGVLEAMRQGQMPSKAGAGPVATLDARTIERAEVSPGNGRLTLRTGGRRPTTLSYSTDDDKADEVLRAILERSGRTFRPVLEPISRFEAVFAALIFGAFGGLFLTSVFDAATELAMDNDVEVEGFRRHGLKWMLIPIADNFGINGAVADLIGLSAAIAAAAPLLALILWWASTQFVRRPERTVWLPAQA